ncbi:aminotransferase class I/II-fold pyridoxal phosphate-dependent enzyme [Leptospira interrogans]
MSEGRPRPRLSRSAMLDLAQSMASRGRQAIKAAAPLARYSDHTDFSTLPAAREMKRHRAIADIMDVQSPFFRLHEGRSGATCEINGRSYLNFVSYDYLGLNGAPEVSAAAKAAIDVYGTSVSASRPTAGDRPLHRELERELADLYQTEDALTFVSGHGTNVSVVGELLDKGDLLLFDALCHNSIVLGSRLSGAARKSFPHNDVAALEAILKDVRHKYERVLIVVEGLYSMDGDIALLPELIELKTRYGAWLMVDEAHSLGVLGATGRGVFEHFGTAPAEVDIWMGTLSKTLSGCGGYIAGCSELIEVLRFHASAFMFSVGMSPPVAAAALAALRMMLAEPQRVAALQENGALFIDECRKSELDVGLSAGYAVDVVLIGDSMRAAKLAERLFERGINTIPVTYPAVPMRGARLRFFLTSEHTVEQIRVAVRITREELDNMNRENFGLKTATAVARVGLGIKDGEA